MVIRKSVWLINKRTALIRVTCLAAITSSAAWLYYQLKKTQQILHSSLDTSVLTVTENLFPQQEDKDNYFFVTPRTDQDYQKDSLTRLWNSVKFAFAKRLLNLAHNDNRFIRKKAVRQLARIKTLDPWHFALLSSMIDANVAVGLARTEKADLRLFSKPSYQYLQYSQEMLVEAMKQLFLTLHSRSLHPCMGYFISKVFLDPHDIGRSADHESTPMDLTKFIQSQSPANVLPMCIESLLHHASLGKYSKDIVELNGLVLLMEIYNRFKDNEDIVAKICRILSYISTSHDFLDDLFSSGWVAVLAKWVNHENVQIAITASKALANLDRDEESVFYQRLYPLHPLIRTTTNPKVDVIFVHGLLGGVFYTWRQRDKSQETLSLMGKRKSKESISGGDSCTAAPTGKPLKAISDPVASEFIVDLDEKLEECCCCPGYEIVWEDIPVNSDVQSCGRTRDGPYSCPEHNYKHHEHDNYYSYCWPRDWLAQDCENLRIIGVNYESNLSMWASICPMEKLRTLEERCEELIIQMKRIGLGRRPIVWVTHSMGGVIVKNLLCKALVNENKDVKNMCLNTRGIVFYSTPHTGSNVAKLNQGSALLFLPTIEVQELQENSSKLLKIHETFLEVLREVPMKIVSFVETKSTVLTAMKFKILIVEPHSGNPGFGEYYEIPQDHLGICKPANKHSFLYQKVLHLIQDIMDETGEE